MQSRCISTQEPFPDPFVVTLVRLRRAIRSEAMIASGYPDTGLTTRLVQQISRFLAVFGYAADLRRQMW